MTNPYDLFGLESQATAAEIKKKYRQIAKLIHPDTGGSQDDFTRLGRAYDVLKDPDKRAAFDHGRLSLDKEFNEASGRAYQGPKHPQNTWGAGFPFSGAGAHQHQKSGPDFSARRQEEQVRQEELRRAEEAIRAKRRHEAAELLRQEREAKEKQQEAKARAKLKDELTGMKARLSEIQDKSETLMDRMIQDRLDVFGSKTLETTQSLSASVLQAQERTLKIMNDSAAVVADFLSKKPKTYEEVFNEGKEAEYQVRLTLHSFLKEPNSAPSLYIHAAGELREILRTEGVPHESIEHSIEKSDMDGLKTHVRQALEKTKPGILGAVTGAGAKHREKEARIFVMIENVSSLEKGVEKIKQEIGAFGGATDFYWACRVSSDIAPSRPVPMAVPAAEICLNKLRDDIGLKCDRNAASINIEELTLEMPEILNNLLRSYNIRYFSSCKVANVTAALSQGNREKITNYTRQKIEDIDAFVEAFERAKNKRNDKYDLSIQEAKNTLAQGISGIAGLISDLDTGAEYQDIVEKKKAFSSLEYNVKNSFSWAGEFARADAIADFLPFERIGTGCNDDTLKRIRHFLNARQEKGLADAVKATAFKPDGFSACSAH